MLPVLFSIGPISISSFGFFLSLGFLYGAFLVWRLAKAWDLDEEKVLDLVLLTFFGGLIGARVYFVLLHLSFFSEDLFKAFLITKYPGFSLWGSLLGGWLSLFFFTRRFKLNFFQIADIAVIGFLGGNILGNIGCLLGSCSVGVRSDLFLAVNIVGEVGKRFPVQALEALMLILVLRYLWPKAIHFHIPGKILSLGLMLLGLVKFFTEFLRKDKVGGEFLAATLIVLGVVVFYKITKRGIIDDLQSFLRSAIRMITESQFRERVLSNISISCYNYFRELIRNKKIEWSLSAKNLGKFLKKVHVKPTPKDFKPY